MTIGSAIRVGLVGLGRVAPYHVRALQRLAGLYDIVGAADTSEHARARYDWLPTYATVEQLAAASAPDVVVVATTTGSHYGVAKSGLSAGCHVLVEKPAVDSGREWRALLSLADSHGLCIQSALHFSHAREVVFFREWSQAEGSALGALTAFHSVFRDPYVVDGRETEAGISLGGSWRDSGVNALSAVAWAFDDASVEMASQTELEDVGPDDVATTAQILFSTQGRPGLGVVDINWCLGTHAKSTTLLFADCGRRFVLDHTAESVTETMNGSDVIVYTPPARATPLEEHYVGVYQELAACLVKGEDNRRLSKLVHDCLWQLPGRL